MKPQFFAAITAPALVAGGVFVAGDFSVARVAAPTGATFEMGYPSEVESRSGHLFSEWRQLWVKKL